MDVLVGHTCSVCNELQTLQARSTNASICTQVSIFLILCLHLSKTYSPRLVWHVGRFDYDPSPVSPICIVRDMLTCIACYKL